MTRRFDAVLMDFYGTVSAGDRAAVLSACQEVVQAFDLTVTAEELAVAWGERFFALIEASNHDVFRTLYECEALSLKQTIGDSIGAFDPKPFVDRLDAYWYRPDLHEDATEALEEIARLNLRVCCVSNADTRPLLAAISRHQLGFDAVISSESVRCYKPAPQIFREAAWRMGVAPQRLIHVGDSLHSDVGGASKLGIATAWVCREDRIHDIGTSRANFTLSGLHQLPALLT